MHWDVNSVRVTGDWQLHVEFEDGLSGTLRFLPSFFEGVFSQLRDPERFALVFVDHGAVAWPGDLDLAPDAMYDSIRHDGEMILSGKEAGSIA